MKKKLLISVLGIFLLGCTKDEELIIDYSSDYRYDYQGNFHFIKSSYLWWGGSHRFNDTLTFNGFISISSGTDSILIIKYGTEQDVIICSQNKRVAGERITPILKKDGTLEYEELGWCSHGYFSGKFIGKDSILFHYGLGGNGGGTEYDIIGTRIN